MFYISCEQLMLLSMFNVSCYCFPPVELSSQCWETPLCIFFKLSINVLFRYNTPWELRHSYTFDSFTLSHCFTHIVLNDSWKTYIQIKPNWIWCTTYNNGFMRGITRWFILEINKREFLQSFQLSENFTYWNLYGNVDVDNLYCMSPFYHYHMMYSCYI